MKRSMIVASVLLVVLASGAFAQSESESTPKGWSKLSKGWIPAIEAEGTYDPSYPANVPPKVVDTLLALQKDGITPEYLKKIDAAGTTLNQVIFWTVQGQDAASITKRVLATPGAVKYPPKGVRKPKKKSK